MLLPAARRPVRRRLAADAGLGLVEIIVAMLVFGVIATGIISSVTISLRVTPDSESREVAANLAAQEIDTVRAIGDPYQVSARTVTQTINGTAYSIERTSAWLQPNGVSGTCGQSNANFELKVNVDVSWANQTSTTQDVRSDTLLAPLSSLTNNSTGAIAIYVQDSQGNPQSGVTLSVSPAGNGASAPATQPGATGTDGCSYVGKLSPGDYNVSATRSGPNGTETASTSPPKAVAAGSTSTVDLDLDGAGTLTPDPANNQGNDVLVPNNLTVSYLTNSGIAATSSASSIVVGTSSSGYMAVAGKLGPVGPTATCNVFDPAAWTAGTSNGKSVGNGEREAALPLANNQHRRIGVPMGTVTVDLAPGLYVKDVQVAGPAPGCETLGTTLQFDQLTSGQAELALPYGAWRLYEGLLPIAEIIPVTPFQITDTSNAAGGGVDITGTVTIDPRPLS